MNNRVPRLYPLGKPGMVAEYARGLSVAAYRGDYVKRTVLWMAVACVVAPIAVLCAGVAWILITSNWYPPAMFSQQFAGENHSNEMKTDAAITAILQKNFPSGTAVRDLRSSLSGARFQDVPPPPPDCVPADKQAEARGAYTPCYDNSNQMEYFWTLGFVCRDHITVRWSADEAGNVIRIEGSHSSACL